MKKTASIAMACIAALVLFGSTANAANLIVNGGFEEPGSVSGWIYTPSANVPGWGGDNIEIWESGFNGVTSFEGGQHAELNAHPNSNPYSIYQEFSTEIGQTYEISFAYRARANNSESFMVGVVNNINDIGTSNVYTATMDDHVTGQWSTFTDTFVATSTQSIIYFKTLTPTGTVGNFLDGVAVTAVPIPAAAWLFASALVGLVGFGRRNNR